VGSEVSLIAVKPRTSASEPDRWLITREAAEYLGLSIHAMHRLTAERSIPLHQEGPGARCFFKRSELDKWRGRRPDEELSRTPQGAASGYRK
jgi:excisionase family DNA binding protein